MKGQRIEIREMFAKFEVALGEYGLSYTTRLEILNRAETLVRYHESRGEKHLNEATVADYYKEIGDRFYKGEFKRKHNEKLEREVGRFLRFAKDGTLKLPNFQKGCRQAITPVYAQIAERFLSGEMHPNTRNDVRWVVHKYFAWLHKYGYENLEGVGAEQIQKFLLDCTRQLSMNSIH